MFSVLPVIVAQKHPYRNDRASLAHSYSDSSVKAEATAFHYPAVLTDSDVCLSQVFVGAVQLPWACGHRVQLEWDSGLGSTQDIFLCVLLFLLASLSLLT